MKKRIVLTSTALLLILLFSCNIAGQNEAKVFLDGLEADDIVNTMEIDGMTYGVYLSDNSPITYNTMTNAEYHFVTVKLERSYVYLYDEANNDTSYHYYKDTQIIYYMNRTTFMVYSYEAASSVSSELSTLADDNLESLVTFVKGDLGYSGGLTMPRSLFPVIEEAFGLAKASDLVIFGKQDKRTITFITNSDEIIEKTPLFVTHLHTIYDNSQYLQIMESIQNANPKEVLVEVTWNVASNTLSPVLRIYRNQLEYYVIDPYSNSFSFDLFVPNQ